jgi:hypothetical protein
MKCEGRQQTGLASTGVVLWMNGFDVFLFAGADPQTDKMLKRKVKVND